MELEQLVSRGDIEHVNVFLLLNARAFFTGLFLKRADIRRDVFYLTPRQRQIHRVHPWVRIEYCSRNQFRI